MVALVNGSLELITDTGDNRSLPVNALDPAQVPFVAGVLFGVTAIAAVDPPTFTSPGQDAVAASVKGQWTATTPDLHNATLLLHQETPFDRTALGRWLAQFQGGV